MNKKRTRYPSKRTLNLAKREKHTAGVITTVVGIAVILLVSALIAKFGVLDQMERLNQVEAQYAPVHTQYTAMKNALERYDEVEREYRSYPVNFLKNEEHAGNVDRSRILNLVERVLRAKGEVNAFDVDGNRLSVTMSGMTLAEISTMLDGLKKEPMVSDVTLQLASTKEENVAGRVEFSLVIDLQQGEAKE